MDIKILGAYNPEQVERRIAIARAEYKRQALWAKLEIKGCGSYSEGVSYGKRAPKPVLYPTPGKKPVVEKGAAIRASSTVAHRDTIAHGRVRKAYSIRPEALHLVDVIRGIHPDSGRNGADKRFAAYNAQVIALKARPKQLEVWGLRTGKLLFSGTEAQCNQWVFVRDMEGKVVIK